MLAVGFFAMCTGASLPMVNVLFGQIIDAAAGIDVAETINQLCIYMAVLGGFSAFASFFTFSCFIYSSARQSTKIRAAYLRAVLRQDMTYFDSALPGEVCFPNHPKIPHHA